MGKSVYIAEKPSVAQEFAKALHLNLKRKDGYLESDEAIVTWCVGHLVTMSYPEVYDEKYKRLSLQTLPFIPQEFLYEDEFCDWYIELVKYRIYHSDENYKSANAALWTLKTVLGNALKMLHPFMPFVTEEIYSALVPEEKSLMMSDWPQFSEDWCYADAENITDHMKEVIRGVRNARAEMNVPPSRKAKVYVVCEDEKLCEGFEELTTCACPLMSASELVVQADKAGIADDAVSIVVPDASVYVPLEELIDFEQEIERLTKEEEKLTKEINRAKGMLSNEKFVSKAPQAKVDEEKAKLEKYTQMMEQVKERLEALKAGR